MKQKFDVTGMSCAACSAAVERAVNKLDGVDAAQVNLLANSMQVEYDEAAVTEADICAAVEKAGYGASPAAPAGRPAPAKAAPAGEDPAEAELRSMKKRLAVSLAFLIPLMYVSMGHMMGLPLPAFFHGREGAVTFALTQFLLVLPILYVNRKFYAVGFKSLWHRSPNMDSLIALGSAAAVVYGLFALYRIGWGLGTGDMELVDRYRMDLYFESAGTILTLITLGKFLEARAKGRTGAAIRALMDLAPDTALVLRSGVETEIPAEEVAVGDTVVIKPGMRIPVDGTVLTGLSSVDESAVTGESIPAEKAPGARVIAASINRSGSFTFRAEKVGQDTTLAQIIALVQDAGATKAPIAKLADKVSGVFVPVVIAIALVSFGVWLALGQTMEFALARAISVLVISCPCASWWARAKARGWASFTRTPRRWKTPIKSTPWCWTRPAPSPRASPPSPTCWQLPVWTKQNCCVWPPRWKSPANTRWRRPSWPPRGTCLCPKPNSLKLCPAGACGPWWTAGRAWRATCA